MKTLIAINLILFSINSFAQEGTPSSNSAPDTSNSSAHVAGHEQHHEKREKKIKKRKYRKFDASGGVARPRERK